MNKFTFDNMPQLRVLGNEQVKEMHEKALYVLENLGIIFAYDEALDSRMKSNLRRSLLIYMTETANFTAHSAMARPVLIREAVPATYWKATARLLDYPA